jgi:hypothetical protein
MKISITRRYLSTNFWVCKTIYLFDLQFENREIMVKKPEIVGLVLVAIMILAFVGAFKPQVPMGMSPVFWACAVGALAIIFYRKWKGKQEKKEN